LQILGTKFFKVFCRKVTERTYDNGFEAVHCFEGIWISKRLTKSYVCSYSVNQLKIISSR